MTEPSLWSEKFRQLKVCVLVPTYNNAGSLQKVVDDILEYTTDIIIVNDGSTDNTSEILKQYPQITIIGHDVNVGKGFALRKGFKKALELGYHYSISIDSDGQHYAYDLPVFLEKLEKDGPQLIMGARNMDQESVPGKSSFGNKFSSFWYWIETGIRLPDTQSGYRLYPIALMKNMRFFTVKFEFEIEVIVRAAWKGIKVVHAPVSVFYPPPNVRISHFRPFMDITRITALNVIFVLFSFFYIRPRDFILSLFKKKTYKELINEVVNSEHTDVVKSVSVAFGVFMGIVPLWGFQLVTAIFLAFLFRLNKALVIISANISIPPMIPIIIFLSYHLGAIWMGDDALNLSFHRNITLEEIKLNFVQYIFGSISLATVAAIIFGCVTWIILKISKQRPVT